jgi:hypothetical protein
METMETMETMEDTVCLERQVSVPGPTELRRAEWRSCCFVLDRRCLRFLVQVLITVSMMGFSMYKLVVSEACSPDQQVFTSMLTLCLSIWLPAPSIHKNE